MLCEIMELFSKMFDYNSKRVYFVGVLQLLQVPCSGESLLNLEGFVESKAMIQF